MRVALVVAPFATATEKETADTRTALTRLVSMGWCPVFLPYALQYTLDDKLEGERAVALEASKAFVRLVARDMTSACFQVGDRVTNGMRLDLDEWISNREGQRHAADCLAHVGLPTPWFTREHSAVRRIRWNEEDRA